MRNKRREKVEKIQNNAEIKQLRLISVGDFNYVFSA